MRPPDLGPQPLPAPEPPTRALEFVDADHVQWRVMERDARHDPGARGHWCLIFASADALRGVWDYPPAWRELSAAQLVALSWHR